MIQHRSDWTSWGYRTFARGQSQSLARRLSRLGPGSVQPGNRERVQKGSHMALLGHNDAALRVKLVHKDHSNVRIVAG
jgi:hypothetical protein